MVRWEGVYGLMGESSFTHATCMYERCVVRVYGRVCGEGVWVGGCVVRWEGVRKRGCVGESGSTHATSDLQSFFGGVQCRDCIQNLYALIGRCP